MRFRSVLVAVLCSAASFGARMDLAPFGDPLDGANPGIEWRDERDVHEVRVRFAASPPGDVRVQYWQHFWPDDPPHMPTIEDHADDRWQGEWRTAAIRAKCLQSDCTYTFEPLAVAEYARAKNLPGVRYRRTLKIRLTSGVPLPRIERLSVFSDSEEREVRLRIVLGQGAPAPEHWTGGIEISNGQIESVAPWNFGTGDSFDSAQKWAFTSGSGQKGLLVNAIAATPSLAGSLDATLITVRAASNGEPRTFTFNVQDLKQGPLYLPDFRAWITDSSQSPDFVQPTGKGPRIRTQIPRQPEQSYERASREIPPLDPWQDQYGRRIYLPLAADSSWQKFALEYGGDAFISKHGTKAMGKELARLGWNGDRIAWKIGTGPGADDREDRKATIELERGDLPVVRQHWSTDGVRYREEAFATLLNGPLAPDDEARSEQTPAILMLRITAENSGGTARTGNVWLYMDPGEALEVEGHRVYASGSRQLRAVFDGQPPPLEQVPKRNTNGAHFIFPLPAGASHSIVLALPFPTDLAPADTGRMERLNYEQERRRVLEYWSKVVAGPNRFSVPEPMLNRILPAVVWHMRMSTTKDPASGLYMVPAAGYDYKVYANEACYQILLLDALGDHRTATAYLDTLLKLQGSKTFPGLHRGMEDAIFHGLRVSAEYDYTASTYGLDHPVVLWTLGEHYLASRDRKWLLHAWPHMDKAIAWILSQRATTRRTGPDGRKVREYGLLPASSLEDNSDWANWFSINSFAWAGLDRAARALAAIGHPEAARIRREADSYREELRAAILRATEQAPVTRLRDGTYAPSVPVEPNQRFARFGPARIEYLTRYGTHDKPMLRLSATREVLYGPIIHLNLGLFGADEPIANWVLDEWEDNITLTSGLGINVHGFTDDRYWFSQGSMVFQANLQNPILVYLKRHEIPAAIRGLYNNLAACFYPEANQFTEEFREWSHASGPFYKVPDEAKFVNRVRDMLVLEDGDSLYLASGVPRRWLASREGIRVEHLASTFGPVSYTLRAGEQAGTVDASIELPQRNPAKTAWLVIRAPSGKIESVSINGQPWNKIDRAREAIELPRTGSRLEVRIQYR